ncbi:hypothetical protein Tco_0716815 [Tanacetum coccineum]
MKSQFMRELREDTFSGNKNDDAYEHVEIFLDIINLFNIPGVTHDAVLLRVFPITLTGAAKRYCPPSKMAKQLEEIHNFKQEGDETLYQACERSTSRRVSNDNSTGIAAITNKLDSLGRDMKKLKENVHAIQVGCEICGRAHLNKECPLHEEVKSVEEVKYRELRRPFPNNNGNGARYRVGPPGYYTHMDNQPPFGEKKPSLEELMNKHIKESTRKRAKIEEWMKKLQDSMELNTRNQNASLKNLETQIEKLAKDYQARAANEVLYPLVGQCKAIFANNEASIDEASSKKTNKFEGISFIPDDNEQVPKEMEERAQGVLPCQLPPKELKPGSFTLPYTIGSLNFYAIENLGIVENVLVKNNKFLFPSEFMIIDMLGDHNETMILGRPFFATIHARIDVFDKEILVGIGNDKIVFDMNRNVHHPVVLVENTCMISDVQGEEPFNPLEIGDDLFSYESPLCLEFEKHNHLCLTKKNNEDTFVSSDIQEDREGDKGMTTMAEPKTTTLRLH